MRSGSDPIARAIQPPENESPQAREERLKAEARAKKINDDIDEQIKQERNQLKKRKQVRVLLLGQSESGKSTTLKQFQILHTPTQFHAERVAWRAVIYLNLVRSIRRVLQALEAEDPTAKPRDTELEKLKLRLAPIRGLEEELVKKLSSTDENEAVRLAAVTGYQHTELKNGKDPKELSLRTTNNWKKAFIKQKHRPSEEVGGWWDDPSDPVHLLNACADDMISLWNHPTAKEALSKQRMRMEESSGFFLDELHRITDKRYIPSDDDVLKARLKTVGVVEHSFTIDKGSEKGVDWKIFDVGGARSQRQYWAPYFSEVDAIIFLAPISAFDQVLIEDPEVNRLEDSLLLWRTVISNKLLENVNIVLFLNKCDLLEFKLTHGVKLADHMTSYGDRPNDFDTISRYFKNKFTALHQSFSPNQRRELYIHMTSVTDTRKTSSIITNVRDIILRKNLEGSRMI